MVQPASEAIVTSGRKPTNGTAVMFEELEGSSKARGSVQCGAVELRYEVLNPSNDVMTDWLVSRTSDCLPVQWIVGENRRPGSAASLRLMSQVLLSMIAFWPARAARPPMSCPKDLKKPILNCENDSLRLRWGVGVVVGRIYCLYLVYQNLCSGVVKKMR